MAAGYGVILSDLEDAARSFATQASSFQHVSSESASLKSPDTGDRTLDEALSEALQRFSLVMEEFYEKIAENGRNLQKVHDNYKQTDADVARLLDTLTSDAGSGT